MNILGMSQPGVNPNDATAANDNLQLALAAGLLSGRGSFGGILGRSLAGGLEAYNQGLGTSQKGRLINEQISSSQAQTTAAKRKADLDLAMRQARMMIVNGQNPGLGGAPGVNASGQPVQAGSALPGNFDFKSAGMQQNAGIPQPAPTVAAPASGGSGLDQLRQLSALGLLGNEDVALFKETDRARKDAERDAIMTNPNLTAQQKATQLQQRGLFDEGTSRYFQSRYNPNEGIQMDDQGNVSVLPGALQSKSALTSAQENAREAAKATYDLQPVIDPVTGRPAVQSRMQTLRRAGAVPGLPNATGAAGGPVQTGISDREKSSIASNEKNRETINANFHKDLATLRDGGRVARSQLAQLETLNRLNDTNLTGALTPLRTTMESYAAALGFKSSTKFASTAELFRAISNDLTLYKQLEQVGVQTSRDTELIQRTLANLSGTPQGNRAVLQYMTAANQLIARRAEFFEKGEAAARAKAERTGRDVDYSEVSSAWNRLQNGANTLWGTDAGRSLLSTVSAVNRTR